MFQSLFRFLVLLVLPVLFLIFQLSFLFYIFSSVAFSCWLSNCIPSQIISELTWKSVISWSRAVKFYHYVWSLWSPKFSRQSTWHRWQTVLPIWGKVSSSNIIGPRTRKLILYIFAPNRVCFKISNTAIFIFWQKICAFFVNLEANWI